MGNTNINSMNEFYVYMYRRNDTNDVFYIGKGKGYRAEMINGHNDHCIKVANKYGFTIEYVRRGMSEKDALQLEKDLLHKYVHEYGYSIEIEGLRDRSNPHNLCNHTMGGEGNAGFRWDDAHKELFRQYTTERNKKLNALFTPEAMAKRKQTMKEKASRGELYIQSKEFRERQAERMRGDGNPAKQPEARKKISQHASTWQRGARNNKAIGAICIDNGLRFETQTALAKFVGCSRTATISEMFKKSKNGIITFNINGEELHFKRVPKTSSKA